jgi:hypothetical protein
MRPDRSKPPHQVVLILKLFIMSTTEKLSLYHYNQDQVTEIKFDQYGRPYVQEYTEYDSQGNVLSVGGKFMLSVVTDYEFTIEN